MEDARMRSFASIVLAVIATVLAWTSARAADPSACSDPPPSCKIAEQDRAYLDHKLVNLIVGSLEFEAEGKVTNGVFDSNTIGQRAVSELDETEFVYGVGIGWVDRPVLRDFHLLTGDAATLREYRGKKGKPWRWALMEAVQMSAGVGWGTTIVPDENRREFVTQDDLTFEVGIKYSVPLENLGSPYSDD